MKTSILTLLRFYALVSPCLLLLSCEMAAQAVGVAYTAALAVAFSRENGRKYIHRVCDAYNNIFTFDKI